MPDPEPLTEFLLVLLATCLAVICLVAAWGG